MASFFGSERCGTFGPSAGRSQKTTKKHDSSMMFYGPSRPHLWNFAEVTLENTKNEQGENVRLLSVGVG